MPAQFIGLKDLKPGEPDTVLKITEHYHNKIKIKFPKFLLKVHIKRMEKSGKKVKFSAHLRLESPDIVAVSDAHDWDLTRTLHESFKKLQRELSHKFKLEGHLPKP